MKSPASPMYRPLYSSLGLSLAVMILFASGCGKQDPGPLVDDPRAYLIDKLHSHEFRSWWAPYAPRDEALFNLAIDKTAKRHSGGIPTHQGKLDRFVQDVMGSYSILLESEEHRGRILDAAQKRFENPPMAMVGMSKSLALLDYHYLPGEWGHVTRITDGLTKPPAIGDNGFLTHEVFVKALNRVVTRFPDAFAYEIRARYFSGSIRRVILYQVIRTGGVVRQMDHDEWYLNERITFDDLLAGKVNLFSLKWAVPVEGEPGPGMRASQLDPLPSLE